MKPKTAYYIFMLPVKRIEFIGHYVRRESAMKRASKWYYDFVLLEEKDLARIENSLWMSLDIAKKYAGK